MGEIAALMVTGLGVGLNAAGQLRSGNAQKNISNLNADLIEKAGEENAQLIEQGSEANAQINEFNARIAEAQARDAIFRGRETENRFRKEIRGTIGAQRAAYAAQGIDVNQDSALDVQTDTAYQGELDALTLRTNAAREAWGYQVSAADAQMQADAERKLGKLQAKSTRDVSRAQALSSRISGQNAQNAGIFGATGTIVSAAGSMLQSSYGFPGKGAGGGSKLSFSN